jgi:hypothetical protein
LKAVAVTGFASLSLPRLKWANTCWLATVGQVPSWVTLNLVILYKHKWGRNYYSRFTSDESWFRKISYYAKIEQPGSGRGRNLIQICWNKPEFFSYIFLY